jgi:hypothetical protein
VLQSHLLLTMIAIIDIMTTDIVIDIMTDMIVENVAIRNATVIVVVMSMYEKFVIDNILL